MKVLIIHGAYSRPQGNWFPWLKEELESRGFGVSVPKFPTPVNQSLERWKKVVDKEDIGEDAVLVGHSLGAAFILNWLEEHHAVAAFLVAGFHRRLGISLDKLNSSFIDKEFRWDAIKGHCGKRFCISSGNDPYIPLDVSRELAEKMGAELALVGNGGHLNKESGYTGFPLLKRMILENAGGR